VNEALTVVPRLKNVPVTPAPVMLFDRKIIVTAAPADSVAVALYSRFLITPSLSVSHRRAPRAPARSASSRLDLIAYAEAMTGTITIVHTGVGPELRGHGVGLKLVEAAVTWARAHGLHIIPVCEFAKATFEKHAELRDVLAR
jgi:predicted GNAT family acetyltransferase